MLSLLFRFPFRHPFDRFWVQFVILWHPFGRFGVQFGTLLVASGSFLFILIFVLTFESWHPFGIHMFPELYMEMHTNLRTPSAKLCSKNCTAEFRKNQQHHPPNGAPRIVHRNVYDSNSSNMSREPGTPSAKWCSQNCTCKCLRIWEHHPPHGVPRIVMLRMLGRWMYTLVLGGRPKAALIALAQYQMFWAGGRRPPLSSLPSSISRPIYIYIYIYISYFLLFASLPEPMCISEFTWVVGVGSGALQGLEAARCNVYGIRFRGLHVARLSTLDNEESSLAKFDKARLWRA